jgi:Transposase zinc-binding domain/Putative transposase/Pyridine nucleotide-disulphide oxidoreductase
LAAITCCDRHCPKCQSFARFKWLQGRQAELLNTQYFHVVFTLPQQIAAIAYQNKRELYGILFRATAQTLLTIAADPKHLGAEIGFFAVLHTWGSNLLHHPHLHCVVTGGGLSATPNPILQELPIKHDSRGAVLVDRTLAIPDYGNVWALGDCASVPDTKPGKTCPPTAQVATREAVVLAHNIRAYLLGRPLKPFCFKSLGTLCIVGYHTACAKIRGLKFSGLFAWLLWRGVYLSKLPGLERKVRVLTDWTLELFFPRDIVQTIDFDDSRTRQADPKMTTL